MAAWKKGGIAKLTGLVLLCAVGSRVKAADYQWIGENWADWGTASNWSPNGVPGTDERLFPSHHVVADLGGKAWELGRVEMTADWSNYNFWLRNGTLRITCVNNGDWEGYRDHGGVFQLHAGAVFEIPRNVIYNPCTGAGSYSNVTIFDGGTMNLLGKLRLFSMNLDVQPGGTITLDPQELHFDWGYGSWTWKNAGTMNLPNGLVFGSNTIGVKFDFLQNGGILNLGGPIVLNGSIPTTKFELAGGTVNVTGDASISGFEEQSISGFPEVCVAANKTLDLSNFTVADGATINKTGAGKVIVTTFNGTLSAGEIEASTYAAIEFAGGTQTFIGSVEGLPQIASVTVAPGEKVRLSFQSLVDLPDGDYTVVASCGNLTMDDFAVTIDESVTASCAIVNGALVLTKNGLSANIATYEWNSDAAAGIWTGENWTVGGEGDAVAWTDGVIAKFAGEATDAKATVTVAEPITAGKVVVEGGRDYQFDGALINTLDFTKEGDGQLILNNAGVSCGTIAFNGGTLAFGAGAADFVAEPVEVNVAANATVALKGVPALVPMVRDYLLTFRYIDKNQIPSGDWKTCPLDQYAETLYLTGLESIMGQNKLLPDGSGRGFGGLACAINGKFYVPVAGDWSFWGSYDDQICLLIDGTEVFTTRQWDDAQEATKRLSVGWHDYEIRLRDDGALFQTYGYGCSGGWLKVKKPGEESEYEVFTENTMTLSAVGDAMEEKAAPSTIALNLNLGAGSELTVGSAGLALAAGSVVDSTAAINLDMSHVPTHTVFITCATPELLASVKAKIAAFIGSRGSVSAEGNGLVWEMFATFISTTETDLTAAAGWANGIAAPVGEHITIAGEGVNPVMTESAPDYGSVTVADGAALTVTASREIGNLSLAAGTTLSVTDAAQVVLKGTFATTGEGSVTVAVAEGCTLDLRGVTLATDATLVKTGAGTIIFDQTELAHVAIQEGVVVFPANVAMTLSSVTIGDLAAVKVANEAGALRPAARQDGDGVVTWVSPGLYTGTGYWTTTENWFGDVLPELGDRVRISDGSTVTISATIPNLPSSIEVGDGASLTVLADATLPLIDLKPTATLTLGDNETAYNITLTETPAGSFRLAGETVLLPTVTVTTNAMVNAPIQSKFTNMNMALAGEIWADAVNNNGLVYGQRDFYFGYAAENETAYFNLRIYGTGFINPRGSSGTWDNVYTSIYFMFAESGGQVIVPGGTITIQDVEAKSGKYHVDTSLGGHSTFFPVYYTAINFGTEKNVASPFTVELDNAELEYSRHLHLYGATTLHVKNNSKIFKEETSGNWGTFRIYDQSQLIVENASLDIRKTIDWNGRPYCLNIMNKTGENPSLILRDGADVTIHNINGNNAGTIRVEGDATYLLYESSGIPGSNGSDKMLESTRNAFYQIAGIEIVEGKTLTVKRSAIWHQNIEDQVFKTAVSVSGGGDLVVGSKRTDCDFTLVMTGDSRAAEGSISVAADSRAAVKFADGAVWGGTVVAGGVSLTHEVDGNETPATVTVGTLDLTGDFPIRYWKDAAGNLSCDRIDLDVVIANGGRLLFEAQDGSADVLPSDKFVIGSLSKNAAATLPKVMKGWRVKAFDDPTDASRVILRADTQVGFTIYFR